MATKTLASRIKMKRDTSANWNTNNPILLNGEIIIVDTEAGETRYKIGDGTRTYSQLPFQDEYIRNLISSKQTKITASGILKGDGSGAISAAIAGTDYDVPEVFYIEKANATHEKILSAYNSNKVIIINDNNILYQLDMYGGGHFIFSNFTRSDMYDLGLDNEWHKISRNYIDINLNANQPMGQSSGDFWYQITTA